MGEAPHGGRAAGIASHAGDVQTAKAPNKHFSMRVSLRIVQHSPCARSEYPMATMEGQRYCSICGEALAQSSPGTARTDAPPQPAAPQPGERPGPTQMWEDGGLASQLRRQSQHAVAADGHRDDTSPQCSQVSPTCRMFSPSDLKPVSEDDSDYEALVQASHILEARAQEKARRQMQERAAAQDLAAWLARSPSSEEEWLAMKESGKDTSMQKK